MDESRGDELQRLRRCLRDVVAFSALPSVWTGFDTSQIAAQLCEVVGGTLQADVAYVRIANQESTWVAPGSDPAALDATRREASLPLRPTARVAAGQGELQVLSNALSFDGDDRIVVAARRDDFPDDRDRLLLRLAANQASTWIQRKQAERALAEESAYRRGIENSMAAGVAAVDLNGRQTYVNRAFVNMVGWEAADLVGAMPPFVYWAPEDCERIHAALQEVIGAGPPPQGFVLRFCRRNDERFDAHVLVSPLVEGGRTTGYVACIYDVTVQRAQQRAASFLAEASEVLSRSLNYEEILTSLSEAVVARLADWCFVDVAEADGWFRRIAAAHRDPAHAPLARRFHRRYANATADPVSLTFARGRSVVMNDVLPSFLDAIARDEDHRQALAMLGMRCFASVPMMSRGAAFGVITFAGTETKKRFEPDDVPLFEELGRRAAVAVDNARLFVEAQEANRAKDEFLANVSHELRTPMTAILGWAHLLHISELDPEDVRVGISTIRQSAQSQAKLIDDLLDVSRIISGKLRLNMAVTDLADVAAEAAATIRPAAAAKRQELAVDIREAPIAVLGDGARLQQVLWNLLSNAVKFTPPGGSIAMTVDRKGEDVFVRVSDTGEGIAAESLPRVFDRFRQLSKETHTGLGIGLAIAKELVEMHGGSIRAESDGESLGATFTVTLPAASPTDMQIVSSRRERDHLALPDVRVLVVEDDETTRTLMVTLLRSFGAEVFAAQSTPEALSVVHSFAPQIIVTDIAMPGDDGISLLHQLRAVNFNAPAIAITAYADPMTRQRVLAAGFDAFVSKPIDPSAFARVIARTLPPRQPEAG